MKLVGNFHTGGAVEIIAEGMALAGAAGLPQEAVMQYYSYLFPGTELPGQLAAAVANRGFQYHNTLLGVC